MKKLFEDDRPFIKRLCIAAVIGLALPFTFIIFGFFDLYIVNMGMFPFSINDLAVPTVLTALICFAAITAFLSLLKGFIFNAFASLFAGILIGGYFQGIFLNIDLGELTGDPIDWGKYATHGIINTIIWLVLIIVPFAFLIYAEKKIWRRFIVIAPLIIIAVQGATLVSEFMTADFTKFENITSKDSETAYLSDEGILEVSSKDNVLVFILDRFDAKYVEQANEQFPGFFDDLKGFTYYPNHMSLYCRTYPSVSYMLTGDVSYFEKPAEEYFDEAYKNGKMLPTLRDNNYKTKLYIDDFYAYSDINQIKDLADNVYKGATFEALPMEILEKMGRFSGFRYAPHSFKENFWLSTDEFEHTIEKTSGETPGKYIMDDRLFRDRLNTNGLSLIEDKNNFMYVHLYGCHEPYYIDENSQNAARKITVEDQTVGCMKLLKKYFDEMKRLGVYDNATIIITGDHGKSEDYGPLTTYKTTALFVKPGGSSDEPLKTSLKPVSHANFQATVIQGAKIQADSFGESVWQVDENADPVRRFLYKINDEGGQLKEYEVRGDASDFKNWKFVIDHPIKYNR